VLAGCGAQEARKEGRKGKDAFLLLLRERLAGVGIGVFYTGDFATSAGVETVDGAEDEGGGCG
jgi:hypothetical protein